VFEHTHNEAIDCRIDERSYYLCEVPGCIFRRGTLKDLCAIRKCRSITLSVERKRDCCAILHREQILTGEDFAGAVLWHWGHRKQLSLAIRRFVREDQGRIPQRQMGDENLQYTPASSL